MGQIQTKVDNLLKREDAPTPHAGNTNQKQYHETAELTAKEAEMLEKIRKKMVKPDTLKEAAEILDNRRKELIKHGYRGGKYSDDELLLLAKSGNVAAERFHVRIMESKFLGGAERAGKMGADFKGKSGEGVKYWSTTLDQLEDVDKDPRLIHEKLGLEYDPSKTHAMIIIDTDIAKDIADTKSIVPTFDALKNFSKEEIPDLFNDEELNVLLSKRFQSEYSSLYDEALKSPGIMTGAWDTQGLKKFISKKISDLEQKKLMLKRVDMQDTLGNNNHFLGNGLTKNLLTEQQYGAIETLNFERKKMQLNDFFNVGVGEKKLNAIVIFDELKPL
ncbi:hypothetical protein EA58_11905 [Photobacterium galatheae]|uniref:Uncharacterized protein n=2 Tax=Photobacterium galatheae TaxID=1654360 RepID=A0A066RUB1_9GAMM|nr:hypothetical protein EA58_11905 [Photobacterium galatheae]